MVTISHLTVNGLREPGGLRPPLELGWFLESDRRDVRQEQIRIQVLKGDGDIPAQDSGWMPETRCTGVPVPLPDPGPGPVHLRLRLRVRAAGEESPWAEIPLTLTLAPGTWQGDFISAEPEEDRGKSYGTLLRRTFSVTGPLKEAWLVSTAHGLYHPFLNGQRVCRDEMMPGWTSYRHRLQFQTFDVTALLHPGENAIGVMLGAGWYKGVMGFKHQRNHYGTCTAFAGQIILRYRDGREERIGSDGKWKGSPGPVVFSEIYDGEVWDGRLEQPGWASPGFDDRAWTPVRKVEGDFSALIPQEGPPVRVMERIPVQAMFRTPQGDRVLDFGQNLTGWCETVLEGCRPGQELELQFFEALDREGNVYTENLRGARQTLRHICRGEGREVCRPWFTFQGFRYARVISFPGELRPQCFTACVVHSDLEETGWFSCSNPLLNRLWENIRWSMKDNFLDIPTDCPQRDERLGWLGDIQAFAPTATFLMNTDAFLRKWLGDLAADQNGDGSVPHVVPDILTGHVGEDQLLDGNAFQGGASGWGDAAVVVPWTLWQVYGDTEVLRRQMPSMLSWLSYLDAHAQGCQVEAGDQFGDWLALDAEPGSYKGATPDSYCCAAWYCHSTALVASMLKAIGREEEGRALEEKAGALRQDFCRRYVDRQGSLTIQTQTAHVLALAYGLVPQPLRPGLAGRLKQLLEEAGHLTTGFLGTPPLAGVLSENGCLEEAYDLVLREDWPGWLYQVKRGATTIWEHWDGQKPDGTMWSADMNSFNHYAYGSIGEWLVSTVGGLERDEAHPGFERFVIAPRIGGGLTWAEVKFLSPRGPIRIRWEQQGEQVVLQVEIPPCSRGEIRLPQGEEIVDGDTLAFREGRTQAPSGSYRIVWRRKTS